MSFIKKISVLSLSVVALAQGSFACEHRSTASLCDLETTSRTSHSACGSLAQTLRELDSARGIEACHKTTRCDAKARVVLSACEPTIEMLPASHYHPVPVSTLGLIRSLAWRVFVRTPGVQETFTLVQHLIRKQQARLSYFDSALRPITGQ